MYVRKTGVESAIRVTFRAGWLNLLGNKQGHEEQKGHQDEEDPEQDLTRHEKRQSYNSVR